jgi:hypothetical protein
MALTKDDLRQVQIAVKDVFDEIIGSYHLATKDDITEIEYNLRDEITHNRREIYSVKAEIKELREKLTFVDENRTADSDLAFTEILKYIKQIDDLEERVVILEKKLV